MRALSIDHVLRIVHDNNPLHAIFVSDAALAAATLATLILTFGFFCMTIQASYRNQDRDHQTAVLGFVMFYTFIGISAQSQLSHSTFRKPTAAIIGISVALLLLIIVRHCRTVRYREYNQLQLWALLSLASLNCTFAVALMDVSSYGPTSHLTAWGIAHELLWLTDLFVLIWLFVVAGRFIHVVLERD